MQRRLGEGGAEVPALYRVLLRTGLKRASAASGDTSALRGQLAALASEGERLKALMELVREDIAAVLTLPGASSVRADVPLKELGLDSLMAVELRNRLSARVGTKLPTTLAFDYPTPTAMAQLLLEKLSLNKHATWRQPAVAGVIGISKPKWLESIETLLGNTEPEFLRQLDLQRRLSALAEMNAFLEQDNYSCVVPLRAGFGNQAVLYVPGLGHGAIRENAPALITQLPGEYPIAGLNPYPLAHRGLLTGSLVDLAANYAPHVDAWIGQRSIFLVGGSWGGLVAMSVASELERRGKYVTGVALLDSLAPNIHTHPPIAQAEKMALATLMKTYGLAEHEDERLAELLGAPSTLALREMIRDNFQCLKSYTFPVVTAPIHLLHAKEWNMAIPHTAEEHALPDLGWSRFGLNLASIVMVEGDHHSIYMHPEMANHIDALVKKASS
jgi:thioesterase domain-containing protein/acyl carrier protein